MDKIILKRLREQVASFIEELENYNKKHEFPRHERDYRFLEDFFIRFFEDRNYRASEVESEEYKNIMQSASEQFPATTLWNLCMDGRVLAVLVNGASAKIGSSVRVPGGILREFVYSQNGKLMLIEDSKFAFIMRRALERFKTKKIYEVYDSHIGCAARKAEELSHGKDPHDAGLLADVLFKREMAEATMDFVNKHYSDNVKIIPIQISFDPQKGFLYMGLETSNALAYAQENGGEFTKEVLDELVDKKLIISTEQLLEHALVSKLFKKYSFDLNWGSDYTNSAKNFWQSIAEMKKEILPVIYESLISIYPHLAGKGLDEKEELEERGILLLTSSFSGYLNNKYYLSDSPNKGISVYPYSIHREEGVKLSEGGYPPYKISMFVVFSLDEKNLPANTELAATLVRTNRKEKRVIDRSGNFSDAQEFSEAPVPVIVQEIVREKISDEEWQKLMAIEWKDMPEMWDTMTDNDFFMYLQKKTNMSIVAAGAINNLRKRMAMLFDPDQPTAAHLVLNYKVALPVIVGSNRKNYFLVPFVKLGY